MSQLKYNNTADLLTEMARQYSSREAVLSPKKISRDYQIKFQSLTFAELDNLANAYAELFFREGVGPGIKVLMMMRPGLEFTAAVFGIFRTGALPVLIDPGMGRKNFLKCVEQIRPEALLAIPAVHWLRPLFRKKFASVKKAFSFGATPPPGVIRLEKAATAESIKNTGAAQFDAVKTTIDDPAAILFTTGSTGAPKGVLYTHKTFLAQVEIIRRVYGAGPEHVDMSAFPLFALFAVAMGMKSIIPRMDFTRPALVDPEVIIHTVKSQNVSFSFGSPALWRNVGEYCRKKHISMPSLKVVLMAGAPVNAKLHETVKAIIAPDGETRVPYGATEALPIADFNGSEMLKETAAKTASGHGFCVGRTNPGLDIKVIKASDEPIEHWDESLVLPPEEKGEIVVKGDVVTTMYYQLSEATRMAKIKDNDGNVWHRMGDMGYLDTEERLWFCGRKNHRVITAEQTYYSVCTEAVFNNHPAVFRSALVGVDSPSGVDPVLWIQPKPGHMPRTPEAERRFTAELKKTAEHYPICQGIKHFFFKKDFPVDIRHNAKIFREKLAVEAAERLSGV